MATSTSGATPTRSTRTSAIIFVDTEDSNWAFDAAAQAVLLPPLLLAPARPQLREPGGARRDVRHHPVLARPGRRRLPAGCDPVPLRVRGGQRRGRAADARVPQEAPSHVDSRVPGPHDDRRGEPVAARGRVRSSAPTDEPECHMAFDFPVMPRIFYSLRSQSARSSIRVLSETTDVPPGAGWGVFLRNHDELTLEMVSEEYRQAMYGWYAYDPRMRANIGIRRRLAPAARQLARRARARARAAVLAARAARSCTTATRSAWATTSGCPTATARARPMQWTPDRNAGFSTADPGKLYPARRAVARVQLHAGQRRVAARPVALAAALDPQRHPRAQGASGVRSRQHPRAADRTTSRCSRSCASTRATGTQFGDAAGGRILCVFSFSHNPVVGDARRRPSSPARAVRPVRRREFPTVGDDGTITLTLGTQSFYWLHVGDVRTQPTAF